MQINATNHAEISPSKNAWPGLINAYDAELNARHQQLLDDRSVYLSKISQLRKLDASDSSGLQKIYRLHVEQIDQLLAEFDPLAA